MRAFNPGDPYEVGMPRPMATWEGNVEHEPCLLPVPWTQESFRDGYGTNQPAWGVIHDENREKAAENSLCLLCGETVETGSVILSNRQRDSSTGPNGRQRRVFFAADLNGAVMAITDGAPLHERCAKMTMRHCPHLRGSKDYRLANYRRRASVTKSHLT